MVTGQAGPCVGNIVAIPRLGFGGLCLQDGPLAIRVADYASVFAAGVSSKFAAWFTPIFYPHLRRLSTYYEALQANSRDSWRIMG